MTTEYDTSSHQQFVDYYRDQSDARDTWEHFDRVFSGILALRATAENSDQLLVGDIGGGSGTLSRVVAAHGHRAVCVDVSEALIEIGRERAANEGSDIEFHVASATDIPVADGSFDVCIVAELLEHIEDWQACVDEITRVLKPGGAVFFSTTNALCPLQNEFELPLYSWYPAPLKRYFVRRVQTDRPQWANYATYPAFNWFTFYSLRSALKNRGFSTFYDRFDLSLARGAEGWTKYAYKIIAISPLTRFLAYFSITGTTIVACKADQ